MREEGGCGKYPVYYAGEILFLKVKQMGIYQRQRKVNLEREQEAIWH